MIITKNVKNVGNFVVCPKYNNASDGVSFSVTMLKEKNGRVAIHSIVIVGCQSSAIKVHLHRLRMKITLIIRRWNEFF